ncbi:MORN repeat-containing protein 4-like protein [Leptotrombidium deliense]|uniref:MORN repeat-containing protein 4-like protein n=1 Tax=Leptotrombidium deliense TaxID=299467 RepID=A0A443SD17_9ACAR|nr:MORN repeat-containing protein 4-like protein [Leptotrombidium deliense]
MNTFNDLLDGCYEYSDGSLYCGEWNKLGEKHGVGVYSFPDGSRYEGRFEKGLPSGLGVMYFTGGDVYIGEFMQGWFNGKGVYQCENGSRFEGEFRGGVIWGKGLTTFSDGSNGEPKREGIHRNWIFKQFEESEELIEIVRNNALNLGFELTGNPPVFTAIQVDDNMQSEPDINHVD